MNVWQMVGLGVLGLAGVVGIFYFTLLPLPSDVLDVGEEIVFDEAFAAPIEESSGTLLGMMYSLGLPGVSISVGVGGEVVWSKAVGYADVEARRPMTTSTTSRIGSVSKSVTSLAVGKMVEAGVLNLEASIDQYGVPFPEKTHAITARQLATHTAGIRHYKSGLGPLPSAEMLSNVHYDTVDDALEIFADSALLFEPGTDFSYSTYGYTLLSAAMEHASGTQFVDYVEAEVFEPLQMTHTTPEFKDATLADTASYYVALAGKLDKTPEVDNSNKWAGGGLLSTPTDLVTMANALLYKNFLQPDTVELLFSPQRLSDGEVNEQNYGIGWRMDTFNFVNANDEVTPFLGIHHGGTSNGANAFLILFPEQGVVVAMTTNALSLNQSAFQVAALRIAKKFIDFLDE